MFKTIIFNDLWFWRGVVSGQARLGLKARVAPLWLAALGCLCGAAAVSGQVVINEVVAANSDRLLRREAPGYPRLGVTTPWMLKTYDDSRWSEGNGPFGFGTFSGVTVVDDYAHNPSKVRAAIHAARTGGAERVFAVFQPHRYSRTRFLAHEFLGAFE